MFAKIAVALVWISPLFAQNTCELAFPPINPPGPTIFTQEQEGFLGDFFEEQARRSTPVYRQPGLTAPLDKIAVRLLQYLPPNSYKFQFTLIELPTANAYAIPGGRIFVSRLLIATLESEDELAGILAHEMGHVLARQASADLTKNLRDALKVSAVTDRADVYAKLNTLIDTRARNSSKASREEDDQLEADRVSSAATWRAGYDPAGLPRWIDRITNNKGATGGFLSDLFGGTRPESKRYREMLKSIEGVPAACRQARGAGDDAVFREWQKRVTELAPEDLLTTLSTRAPAARLTPALRPDLSQIKFSPDGKYLLAQDQSGIFVLQREPLQVLFRIPALGAAPSVFHKDSQHVMFQTGTGRIELWSLATKARERRWDLPMGLECEEVILAADAKTVACMQDYHKVAVLVDLETGVTLAQHSGQTALLFVLEAILLGRPVSVAAFSPDGSVFVLSPKTLDVDPWAYSVEQRKEISIGRPLRGVMNGSFAFLDSGRVAAVTMDDKNSGLFTFPEGKQISKFTIPSSTITAATKGETLLLRPLGNYAVALMSIEEREIFQASTKAALDRYEDVGASERNTGEIALYRGKSSQPVAVLQLPDGGLTGLRSAAHSQDFEWLALSASTRGQVWNLRAGGSSLTPPFDGGSISGAGIWTATFEQREVNQGAQSGPLEKFRSTFDLPRGKELESVKLTPAEGVRSWFSGRFEVRLDRATQKAKARLDVRETASGKLQWTRFFEETPQILLGNALVVRLDPESKDAREMLKKMKGAPKNSEDRELLDVLNLETGASSGQLLIGVGGAIRAANLVGGALFLEDTNNRTLAYSMSSGERTGQQFGRILAVDAKLGRVATSNQLGFVSVLDESLRGLATFEFPRNVIYAGFDGEGKRLLVVTGAQEVFVETLPE